MPFDSAEELQLEGEGSGHDCDRNSLVQAAKYTGARDHSRNCFESNLGPISLRPLLHGLTLIHPVGQPQLFGKDTTKLTQN